VITVKRRKEIEALSYSAIKQLYGIQEKDLRMEMYASIGYDHTGKCVSGVFGMTANSENVYLVELKNDDIVSLSKVGNANSAQRS
jgi:hypothetical protein